VRGSAGAPADEIERVDDPDSLREFDSTIRETMSAGASRRKTMSAANLIEIESERALVAAESREARSSASKNHGEPG